MVDNECDNDERAVKEQYEVEHMCREMDRIYNDGEIVGAKKEKVRVAMDMINDNYPIEAVVKISKLNQVEVMQLQERKKRKAELQLV